ASTPALAHPTLDRPPRRERRQRRPRRRRRGRPHPHRHRHARRGRAALRARRAPGAGARAVVRRDAGRGAPRRGAVVALLTGAAHGGDRARHRGARHRRGVVRVRRAAAREGVRRARPPHAGGDPALPPGAGRAARPARQVLPPPAGRGELVRRDPPPAQRGRHGEPRLPRRARARGVPPGDRALPALPAGAHDRGADPRHRPRGRRGQLLGHGLRLRPRRGAGRLARARRLQLRRPARGTGHAGDERARRAGGGEV
ncbi:MAG: Hypothetical, related to broad specificity phosphatases COG0406, partial [uncultured Gemmatimonadaceae bacterium]